jgi:hypothetical protein
MALSNEELRKLTIEAMEITVGRLRGLQDKVETLGPPTGLDKPLAEIETRLRSLMHELGLLTSTA